MNEQLIVKNFGPIKDATVDFKRVTVFIGPTGGGKSTLAKLASTFREVGLYTKGTKGIEIAIRGYGINFASDMSFMDWRLGRMSVKLSNGQWVLGFDEEIKNEVYELAHLTAELHARAEALVDAQNKGEHGAGNYAQERTSIENAFKTVNNFFKKNAASSKPYYVPAERTLLSVLDENWPSLITDKVALPPVLLFFAQGYLEARSEVAEMSIDTLGINYEHHKGRDFILLPSAERISLNKAASGIQSVVPLMVLIEYLDRRPNKVRSYIVEEPELNLYPTAQQGLLNWLVEKCTKGENDLTITTHSPYILSSCNLLLEAYKIAQQRPELADKVAAIVPRESWINPDEFAAYYVADGTVKPIIDVRTHLIGSNELDAVSGDISDKFRELLRLKKQVA